MHAAVCMSLFFLHNVESRSEAIASKPSGGLFLDLFTSTIIASAPFPPVDILTSLDIVRQVVIHTGHLSPRRMVR